MAVVIDLVTTANSSATTSLTWSHTCSGDDRGLMILNGDQSNSNRPTYNGTTLTAGTIRQNLVAPGNPSARISYLVAPPSGAYDVVATNTYTENMACTAISVTGVSQSISTPATVSAVGTSTAPSVSATGTSANGLFASLVVWTNSTGAAAVDNTGGSSQTEQSQTAMSVVSAVTAAGASVNGTQTLAWTLPTSMPWVQAAFYLTPSASVSVSLSGQVATSASPALVSAGQSLSGHAGVFASGVLQTAITPGPASVVVTVTTTGAGSFTIPANVSSITFEGWGGGGGGGVRTVCEAGGGGGAYAQTVYSVTPTQVVYFTVPTGGGPGGVGGAAWANLGTNSQTGAGLIADYGRNGSTSSTTGGAAGLASNSTGDVKYDGGAGRASQTSTSGTRAGSGGGGGAGSAGAGQLGGIGSSNVAGLGGIAGTPDGGAGGAGGVSAANGVTGTAPAGGGGGGGNLGGNAGSGARGQIKYTYVAPNDVGDRILSLAGQGSADAQHGVVTPSTADPGTVVALTTTQWGTGEYGAVGVTLAKTLLGQSAAGQISSFTPSLAITPEGRQAATEQGFFGLEHVQPALLGQSANAAPGVFPAIDWAKELAGQASTSAAGQSIQGIEKPLLGASLGSVAGPVAQLDSAVVLLGQHATAAIGNAVDDNTIQQVLTGHEAVCGFGTVATTSSPQLTGQFTVSQFQTPAPEHSFQATGQTTSLVAGQATTQLDQSAALIGYGLISAAGSLALLGEITQVLPGNFATGQAGALSVTRTLELAGLDVSAHAHNLSGLQTAAFALSPAAASVTSAGAVQQGGAATLPGLELAASAPASVAFVTAVTPQGVVMAAQVGALTTEGSPNRGAELQGLWVQAQRGTMLRLDRATGHQLLVGAGRLSPLVAQALAADPFGTAGFGEGGYFVPEQPPVAADAADVVAALASVQPLLAQSPPTLFVHVFSPLQGGQAQAQQGNAVALANYSVSPPGIALQSGAGALSASTNAALNGQPLEAGVGHLERTGYFAGAQGQLLISAAGVVTPVISTSLLLGGQVAQASAGSLGTGALQMVLTGQAMQALGDADLGVDIEAYISMQVALTGWAVDGETGGFPGGVVLAVTPQGQSLVLIRGSVRPRIFTADNFAVGVARSVIVPIQILGVEVPIEMNSYTQGVSP